MLRVCRGHFTSISLWNQDTFFILKYRWQSLAAASCPRRPLLSAGSRLGSPPRFPAAPGTRSPRLTAWSGDVCAQRSSGARPGPGAPCWGSSAGAPHLLLLQRAQGRLCSSWEPALLPGENSYLRLRAVRKGSLFCHGDAEKSWAMQDFSV